MAQHSLSYQPLLHEPRDEDDESSWASVADAEKPASRHSNSSFQRWTSIRPLVYHGCVLVFYTLIFFAIILRVPGSPRCGPAVIFSPAREALRYEPRVFKIRRNEDHMGPYFGKPNGELDLAWHNLLQYQNIHISLDELKHFEGRESEAIAFPDGSGFMAQLQVYHDLHCLKRIHHTMWPEYYYPNITDREREELKFHNDHCLDTLRQSIMCHADITLLTMRWGHKQAIPLGNFSAPHECINWDILDEWSKERSVDAMKPGFLIHPTLGPSFPNGRGVRTGVGHDN